MVENLKKEIVGPGGGAVQHAVYLSCYGVKNGFLLIGIETPRGFSASAKPASLNFAGPPIAVTNNGWNSDSVVAID